MDAQAVTREDRTWKLGAKREDGAAGTILLVEDEGFVREVTSEVLRSGGYRVLTAKNAVEAEHEYLQHRGEVDVLLTDVILPGENGRSLAERLRLSDPTLKILLVTGYAEQMGSLGTGEDYLAKPFSTRELLARVKQVMDSGQLAGATDQENREVRPAGGNASPA
jgi:DNA-binding response OmpR family regulator